MRIMHVINGLTTGGAEMMLLKLLSANNGDWRPAVVSLMDEGTIGPKIAEQDIPVYSLGMRRRRLNPACALSLMSITWRYRPQLIQGWMPHGNVMASLAGISSQKRVPVIWNIRMSLYDMAPEVGLTSTVIRLGALLSSHPAAIIYNSKIGASQHEALGYNAAKRVVIPNGFDCQVFRPDGQARRQIRAELGIGNDTILVGLMARYHPMKDHASFLRAAGLLARAHPAVHFVLAGSGVTGVQSDLRRLIAEQKCQDRVSLLGERSDMPCMTAALDIACSASSWGEGFSNAIGEAMACGVPCVVTDVGDSRQIVGDTGVSVPPRDPQAMAQALSSLITCEAAHRRDLGAAARRRIETEFSLSSIVSRYDELYRECLSHTHITKA